MSAPKKVTDAEVIALLADPHGLGKSEVIPSEKVEAFARALRENFIALTRQGFTDQEALHLVGESLRALDEAGA